VSDNTVAGIMAPCWPNCHTYSAMGPHGPGHATAQVQANSLARPTSRRAYTSRTRLHHATWRPRDTARDAQWRCLSCRHPLPQSCLRLSRFLAPLVTPAFGFLCSYGIYYMKGRHRRARFVRIVHYTRLRFFTDANDTHNTHTNTRNFSSSAGSSRPVRSSKRARWGWARPRAVNRRAQLCKKPDLCRRADGEVSM